MQSAPSSVFGGSNPAPGSVIGLISSRIRPPVLQVQSCYSFSHEMGINSGNCCLPRLGAQHRVQRPATFTRLERQMEFEPFEE